jgi:hypothetical protein
MTPETEDVIENEKERKECDKNDYSSNLAVEVNLSRPGDEETQQECYS